MSKSAQTPQTESAARRRWRALIQQQQHSGLSQAEFCRRHGLSPQTLSSYKRLLGLAATPPMDRRPAPVPSAPTPVATPPAPVPAAPNPTPPAKSVPPVPEATAPRGLAEAARQGPAAPASKAPAPPLGFLPLRVRPAPCSTPPPRAAPPWIEVVLGNGRRLRAPPSVDGGDLQRLVVALEGGS